MPICGIAVSPDGRPVELHEIQAMCSSLGATRHDRSFRIRQEAGLASVVGLGSGSFWSSEVLVVACDADLYNKVDLRRGFAPSFCSANTAELIGMLYQQYGPSFLTRLRGAFAIAVWDAVSHTLLLAVDRFGVKRLCYASKISELIFASQPRGLFASDRVAKNVSLPAITNYLVYNVVPSPQTAYEAVTRLGPGEYVLFSPSGVNSHRYWEMRYPEDARGSTRALARELFSRMQEAVCATSADLDISKAGCFLSGGTDSSSIVGLLTKLKSAPVNAFSVGFDEDRFNELEYARIASKHFGARHFEYFLGPHETFQIISKIVAGYDEPFGNASAIPTYACAKLARDNGIETLLGGDGGDELFGGNERYRIHQLLYAYQRIPRSFRRWIIEPIVLGNPLAFGVLGKLQRYIRRSNIPNPERYCHWRLLRRFPPAQVLGPQMPCRNGHGDLFAIMRDHYTAAAASSELNRLLYVDVKMTLGDDDLPKVARTAELAGVNVRFPYLDQQLAEFSGRIPAVLKVRFLEKRYLFKKATRNLLPAAILSKKKHGFGLPIGCWLKTDPKLHNWARDICFDPRTYQRGYFRKEFVESLFSNMKRDNTPFMGDQLWVFLMLELWHRQHVEAPA